MWNWIVSDKGYLDEYHGWLSEIVDVIGAGDFSDEAARVYDLILPYVGKDPKAFYTTEEFKEDYESLIRFSELRAESVRRQVNGQLASKTGMQSDEDKVDTSGITLRDMGSIRDLLIRRYISTWKKY